MRVGSVTVLALLLALAGSASGRSGAPACSAIAVTRQAVPFPHVRSLRAAIARARPCDWILVAPGVYRGAATIRVPDLHVRGLDRNRVILDGGHRVGNGITIEADDVWVENLTVRDFDRRSRNDDATGTQVAWRGVHGWWGRYLTAYDTGLLGGYGLWAARSQGGAFDHASGFDDSGLYVGACHDCRALVEHAVAEHDLVGLAATNASGHFRVEDSLFRRNAVGVSFNSSQSDSPPPQLGTCDAGANRSPAPVLATTRLARCTVFRDNRVLDNNALDVPANTASVRPGAGIGLALLGSYGDLIEEQHRRQSQHRHPRPPVTRARTDPVRARRQPDRPQPHHRLAPGARARGRQRLGRRLRGREPGRADAARRPAAVLLRAPGHAAASGGVEPAGARHR
jgi:hypothetical protein